MTTKTATAPEIPALKKGQKVRDWRGLYVAATAGIAPAQSIAYLPLYVGRDEGEQAIAESAGDKTTLAEALDELQALIDGPPSRVELLNAALDMKPTRLDYGGMTSYFFRMLKEAKRAKITYDIILLRFLKHVRNGSKFYNDKEDDFKVDMTEAKCLALFKELQAKLKMGTAAEGVKIKNEQDTESGFVFNVSEESDDNMPQWAQEMRHDLTEMMNQAERKENEITGSLGQDEEYPVYQATGERGSFLGKRKSSRTSNIQCFSCGKFNHYARNCRTVCSSCKTVGHSEQRCPKRQAFNGNGRHRDL